MVIFFFRNMLRKIEDESYDGKEAVAESRASLSKAEDTIEAAGKEINVSKPNHQTSWLVADDDILCYFIFIGRFQV